ncbi:MAG: hypothetical protein J0M27_20785, partial [Sulfuritalea sp.]|nr:hypothetical protein [Sulfuritalea sp.]
KEGNKWVVLMERTLAASGGKGDHAIGADKVYNFGFAIHEDFTNARYHYVSLGYQFGLDKDDPATKSYINVQKQQGGDQYLWAMPPARLGRHIF